MIVRGRELVGFLPLAELYMVYHDHDRLKVFVEKGRVCVSCGREGRLLAEARDMEGVRYHVDLYTDDLVLMTVDHVVPKKVCLQLGWDTEKIESLDNKQPMCDPCNGKKGCKQIDNKELGRRMKQSMNAKSKLASVEIIRSLVPNIHRLQNDDVWMGRLESNQLSRSQSPQPYRLATSH